MGDTRELFKKIRETKGIFHVKKDTIKGRKDKDLREEYKIKKKWQDTQRNFTKSVLMIWITTMMWSLT